MQLSSASVDLYSFYVGHADVQIQEVSAESDTQVFR